MPQPTNEQFENDLAEAWNSLDVENLVWVEDESKAIGGVFLSGKSVEEDERGISDLYRCSEKNQN